MDTSNSGSSLGVILSLVFTAIVGGVVYFLGQSGWPIAMLLVLVSVFVARIGQKKTPEVKEYKTQMSSRVVDNVVQADEPAPVASASVSPITTRHSEAPQLIFDTKKISRQVEQGQELSGIIHSNAHAANTSYKERVQAITQLLDTVSSLRNGLESVVGAVKTDAGGLGDAQRLVRNMLGVSTSVDEALVRSKDKQSALRKSTNDFGDRFSDIGSISHNIQELCKKTNLLAINASIEAARAGDYGKGFAVVAGEIKVLADSTDKAVHQIDELVLSMREMLEELSGDLDAVDKELDMTSTALQGYHNDAQSVGDVVSAATQNTSGNVSSMQSEAHKIGQVLRTIQEIQNSMEASIASSDKNMSLSNSVIDNLTEAQSQLHAFDTAQAKAMSKAS